LKGLLVGIVCCSALQLAACTRPANEVAVRHSSDERLSCFQIESQYGANLDAIGFSEADRLDRERQNLGAVAGVLLLGVGSLMALDDGSAEAAELQALIARNRRLEILAADRSCPALRPDMDSVVAEIEAAKAAREEAPPPIRPND